jgi:TPP-dependent pyruvate/acetoin dehydrogenase alpha subunit
MEKLNTTKKILVLISLLLRANATIIRFSTSFQNISTSKGITNKANFSVDGNEVAWGTIGNASTSEGLFFETINAAGVLQVPMIISVWDDEYGISVHARHQTTKENISEILKGYQRDSENNGYEILRVKGWDYSDLITTKKQQP